MKLRVLAFVLPTLALFAPLRGAVITWDGSTNGNFSNNTNWVGDSAPAFGDSVIFVSSPNETVTLPGSVTLTDMSFTSATSGGYAFISTGSPTIGLIGNISADVNVDFASAISAINLSTASHTFTVFDGKQLSFNQALNGAGASVIKSGNGTLTLFGTNTYTGTTTVNAGSLYLEGSGAIIDHGSSNFIVSGPSAGVPTVYINNGAKITSYQGRIGINSGTSGDVVVDGAGSKWTINDNLYVGEAGVGLMSITNGGKVSALETSIGNNSITGDGNVSITNGTLENSGNLYVGSEGVGDLFLYNGAHATNVDGHIGNNAGGNGTVTMFGTGATWTNSGNLYVGASGSGTLNLNKGSVTASRLIVGNTNNGNGSIFMNGVNSTVTIANDVRLGYTSASVGSLDIANGATLTSNTGYLGETGTTQGEASIHGANSAWNLSGDLYVGNGATGKLYVYDGGKVTVGGGTGTLHLGHSVGGVGDLYIGDTGSWFAQGGIINAGSVLTGASDTGTIHFGTTATAASPYYFTKDGTAVGANIGIGGATAVTNAAGYNVLQGGHSYSGPTDIYGGTLVAAGTGSSPLGTTGVVTVHNGGTLAVYNSFINNPLVLQSGSRLIGNTGGGSINQATIGDEVTLSPGFDYDDPINGPLGTLKFSDLTLSDGGTLEIKVKEVTGSLTNTSVSVVSPSTLTIDATSGNKFTLKLISLNSSYQPGALAGGVTINVASSLPFLSFQSRAGDLVLGSNLELDTTMFDPGIGSSVDYSVTRSGSLYYLNFTPVPEPSTYALMALGLGGTALATWRRKRRSN